MREFLVSVRRPEAYAASISGLHRLAVQNRRSVLCITIFQLRHSRSQVLMDAPSVKQEFPTIDRAGLTIYESVDPSLCCPASLQRCRKPLQDGGD